MLGLGIVGTIIVIFAGGVAHSSHVIRLEVQSSWSGVGPVAVPRSSVGVHAPRTCDGSLSERL
jgi:hypothetical protein